MFLSPRATVAAFPRCAPPAAQLCMSKGTPQSAGGLIDPRVTSTGVRGVLTCGQVVTRGPRRRMPNPSCGGALSAESRAAPLGELPQGSGEPVTCSGLRCWRTFRPPPAARQPSRPLWGPQSGSCGVPSAERRSSPTCRAVQQEERSGGMLRLWRVAGGIDGREEPLWSSRRKRCSFASGPAAGAALSRLGGGAASAAS